MLTSAEEITQPVRVAAPSNAEQVLLLARESGVVRVRDVIARGISPEYLRRLCQRGMLVRAGRGIYMAADADVTEHHSLAEASKRVPRGVVCLLSALRFHGVTTQAPHEVWMAIDRRAARPQVDYPPIHVIWTSGAALDAGVEEHAIEGVPVRVYCLAKTIADCFKYRNKIGLDVALEALRESWRAKQVTMDDLSYYARICRVANVMRPYLEMLVS